MNFIIDKSKELKTVFICTLIYMTGFGLLENMHFDYYNYTETWIDQYIPFIDFFVIPYVLWFAYIVIGFVYFLLKDREGFYRTCFYIFIGMYICLLVYLLIPNAQGLRIDLDTSNVFEKILSVIYHADTSTNVCPSIHVYNSVMMYVSLRQNKAFLSNKKLNLFTLILTILICLSTVFTKQHAFVDIIYALPLCGIVYYVERSISYTKYLNLKYHGAIKHM